MTQTTNGGGIREELAALFRSRHSVLLVVTQEEERAEKGVAEAATLAQYGVRVWDCNEGLMDLSGEVIDGNLRDPRALFQAIGKATERFVYILRDLDEWMDPMTKRGLRSLARKLKLSPREKACSVVLLATSSELPPQLTGDVAVVDYPLPTRDEMAAILDDVLSTLPEETEKRALSNGDRERVIDASVGLAAEQASNCFAKSIVSTKDRRIDPAIVANEKKRVISTVKGLTWIDPDPQGLDSIAGLDLWLEWVMQRKLALSQKARDYGLPSPRGALLVGVPGCGKSLSAKCVPTAWGIPLIRLDFGAIKAGIVGASESNLRAVWKILEAVSPCILWADEIEKALAGASGPSGDSGVSEDALGSFLTWMQEKAGTVFVIATANDVSKLPAELLRKGRFDEVFFVDLPTEAERRAVLEVTLRKYGRDPETIPGSLSMLVGATAGWASAEVAELVPAGLFRSFADGERELVVDDLEAAAQGVVPLSKTAQETISDLREWATSRARPASSKPDQDERKGRALDL